MPAEAARLAVTFVTEQGLRSSHILSIAKSEVGGSSGDERRERRSSGGVDEMDVEQGGRFERRASKSKSKLKAATAGEQESALGADLRKRLEYTQNCLYQYYVARAPFGLAMR